MSGSVLVPVQEGSAGGKPLTAVTCCLWWPIDQPDPPLGSRAAEVYRSHSCLSGRWYSEANERRRPESYGGCVDVKEFVKV